MPLTDVPGKARALYEARRTRQAIEPFTDADPDLGMADGYAVQQELVKLLLADGDRIVGYKVGLTSKPMQKMIGVDTPDYGPVLGSTVYADGDSVPVSAFIQPKIEAEIAFVLGAPLAGPGVSVLDARRAIAGMTAAVEIVDSRFADWRIKLADTVADLASNGAVAISSRVVPLEGIDPRRPGPGGGLAGQHAGRDGRQARSRAPGHDRGAARRRADAGRGRVPRRLRPPRSPHRPRHRVIVE
jgi:2-keto-4-pentenoate hydratase